MTISREGERINASTVASLVYQFWTGILSKYRQRNDGKGTQQKPPVSRGFRLNAHAVLIGHTPPIDSTK
jgi:hypothetical protein